MRIECERQYDNKMIIQKAIDSLPAEGGEVYVPAGNWQSGRIQLKSNVTLCLDEAAVISFSTEKEDYLPPVFTRWEGAECYNYSPFLYAIDCENIAVTGSGRLVGNGETWWSWKKLQGEAATRLCLAQSRNIPSQQRVFGTVQDALRPSFIQFIRCHRVRLEDFTIQDGPQWTIHPVYCKDVHVNGVHISTHGPNTDGINPDSCQNVLIEHCEFDTGDDCIAINSGLNEDGWRVNTPCTDVEIRNCIFHGGHAAVAIGSAMSGGVERILAHDCVVHHAERGIRVKSMKGRGGYVRNVEFRDFKIESTEEEAIEVTMNYGSSTAVPASRALPSFSDIRFVRVDTNGGEIKMDLYGMNEKIELL